MTLTIPEGRLTSNPAERTEELLQKDPMFNTHRVYCPTLFVAILFLLCCGISAEEPAPDRIVVAMDEDAGHLTLTVDGQTAFVYRFGPTVDLPHFSPFNSSSGRAMTVKIADPYPHHRSFWVADEHVQLEGELEKADIYTSLYSGATDKEKSKWPVAPYKRQVVHVEFSGLKTNGDTAEFDERLTWKNGDVRLLDERRHYRVRTLGNGEYLLDFSFQLRAAYGKVTITRDASHYAIPYIRMNETFSVQHGGGKIVNSEEGVNQAGTHNQLATWFDYSAPRAGKRGAEGLACFIHPCKQPPHLWLTRDYGTWGPRGPGGFHNATFTITEGASYDQRVGLLVHNGDAATGNVSKRYQAYCDGEL